MALVTFTNPGYRDKTVYAVAGSHTQSLLKLALENKIPIDFSCEDGECGTCAVKVSQHRQKDATHGWHDDRKGKSLAKANRQGQPGRTGANDR